jgi:hypothetical protein
MRHRVISSKAKSGWGALATHEPTTPNRSEAASSSTWMPFDGSEQIIVGDLENLTDGEPVRVEKEKDAMQVASAD